MTVKEYLLSRLDWRMAQDPWTVAVMSAGSAGVDSLVERIESIGNAEDFEKMSVERVAYYEALLGISKTDGSIEQRRKAVQAFWTGGGHPSVQSVHAMMDFFTGGVNAAVDYSGGSVNIELSQGTPISPYLSYIMQAAIRRHIPAHIPLVFSDVFATKYLTVSDMESKMLTESTADIPSVNATNLYNFVG